MGSQIGRIGRSYCFFDSRNTALSAHNHNRKEMAVNSKELLENFISFLFLLSLPKDSSARSGNSAHTEQATAAFLLLTRFLKTMLEYARTHDALQTECACRNQLVFRIGTPE
jgi:hypothetical protein